MRHPYRITAVAIVLLGQLALPLLHATARAVPPGARQATSTPAPAPNPSVVTDPDRVLAPGWRRSADRAVTTVGDDTGFKVLVADASSAYQWRTAASLSEPGYDTDDWIGQSCVTGSGRRAVVVYAPRTYTNNEAAFGAGGFAAVVDLTTGAVTKLASRVSLAYFNPGCDAGEDVALTSAATRGSSTVSIVDAATAKVTSTRTGAGELSSPVPYAGGVAAALGDHLVSVDANGHERLLTRAAGVPFRLHPDTSGGLAFQVPVAGGRIEVRRWATGKASLLGTGRLGAVQVATDAGRIFVTGPDSSAISTSGLPGWTRLGGPVNTEPSTTGALDVTASGESSAAPKPKSGTPRPAADAVKHQISVQATVTATGKPVSFTVASSTRAPAAGLKPSPGLRAFNGGPHSGPAAKPRKATTDPGSVTWDPDRGCSVARNDPSIQTYQATAQQVEWAADLAVQGQLTTARGPNWGGSGMSVSWTPQGMFPPRALSGGGSVPAQVLLGVLAQESNTLQASPHAVDGVVGNVDQGGFYGADGTSWTTVDCGYGVGQVTTGMAMNTPAGTSVADGNMAYTTAQQQQAIATDYASNIAASLNMLVDAWNATKAAGILANNGDPKYIENWWFAVWAYNSGIEPDKDHGNTTGCTPGPTCTDGSGDWGVGWFNNPENPGYPGDRSPFNDSPYDTKHPNEWTYPEKVIGWAASPVPRFNYATDEWGTAYAPGTWSSGATGVPPLTTFCTAADRCTPDAASDPNGKQLAGLCSAPGSYCFWHTPVNWTVCATSCGVQSLTYTSTSAKPYAPTVYPADGCTTSNVPANAVIVSATAAQGVQCYGSTRQWTYGGNFSMSFPRNPYPGCATPCIDYPGKIDFHQLGVGFNGHIWFTHTASVNSATGTWTPPASSTGWTRVKVHVPDNGATTQQADYTIHLGNGQTRHRLVNQAWNTNTWVDLGTFDLSSGASVTLSNANNYVYQTDLGDIAYDAVAFIPSQKPVVDYVALGDSYSSGESDQPYEQDSDLPSDACHRSDQAYSYRIVWPGQSSPIQQIAQGNGADDFALLACSGAESINMSAKAVDPNNTVVNTDWGKANSYDNGEPYQVDASGYLDQDTTLVTLTIGGNDARFAAVLQGCIATLTDCTTPGYVLKGDPSALSQYEPYVISLAEPHLEAIYNAIHAHAPNAKIIVLGYPKLFPTDPGIFCPGLLPADQTWMNTMSGELDQAISNAVAIAKQNDSTLNIKFVDPTSTLAGHSVCGSDPWINGLIAQSTTGSGTTTPGVGSFHPMPVAHESEATLIDGSLG